MGRRYRVRYRRPGSKRILECVMQFIAVSPMDEYVFNARPIAGTQVIPKAQVTDVELVPDSTPIYMNKWVKVRSNG